MFCLHRFSTGTITLGWEKKWHKSTFAIYESEFVPDSTFVNLVLAKKGLFQDFEDFDLANEDDVLEEFLGIERENPKVTLNQHSKLSPENKLFWIILKTMIILALILIAFKLR